MKRPKLKLVLHSPLNPRTDGLWLDGKKLAATKASIVAKAGRMPVVRVDLLPSILDLELGEFHYKVRKEVIRSKK